MDVIQGRCQPPLLLSGTADESTKAKSLMTRWSEADLARVQGRNSKAPVNKYRNRKATVDGIEFHSKKEARRYQELLALSRMGEVRKLRLQPRYELCALVIDQADCRDLNAGTPTCRRLPIAQYVADFEYEHAEHGYGSVTWGLIVEDTKGVKTDLYKLKKRWFEAQYGLKIRET